LSQLSIAKGDFDALSQTVQIEQSHRSVARRQWE
jgi:hypothetical protein